MKEGVKQERRRSPSKTSSAKEDHLEGKDIMIKRTLDTMSLEEKYTTPPKSTKKSSHSKGLSATKEVEAREPTQSDKKKMIVEESSPSTTESDDSREEDIPSSSRATSKRLHEIVSMLRSVKDAKEAAAIILEFALRIKTHELVVQGADHAIIAAMKRHSNDCKIQTRGCKALKEIAKKGLSNIESILDMGGADIILIAMEKHRAEEDLQKEACKAIRCLTEDYNPGKQSFGPNAKEAITAIIHAMQDHPPSAALQCLACKALATLAEDSNECSLMVVSQGGIEAIRQSLKGHDDCTAALHVAFEALINIVSATQKVELDEQVAMCISLDRVLATMVLYRKDHDVQAHGMQLLCNLCRVSVRNRSKVATLYGLEVITKSLDICITNKEVQRHGTTLLQFLSQSEGNAVTAGLMAEGGMDLLLQVLRMHGSDPIIVQQVCLTIAKLSRPFADKIRKEGGLELIISGMRKHSEQISVQEAACLAIWKLSQRAENAKAINANGGVGMINAAMKKFPSDRGLQEAACEALAALTQDEQFKIAQRTVDERQHKPVVEEPPASGWACLSCI